MPSCPVAIHGCAATRGQCVARPQAGLVPLVEGSKAESSEQNSHYWSYVLMTIVLLIACALIAAAGAPLILKLVQPVPVYGVRPRRAEGDPEAWYEANNFGGWALVAAEGFIMLALMLYSVTWLTSAWARLAVFVIALAGAVGVTRWHERLGK